MTTSATPSRRSVAGLRIAFDGRTLVGPSAGVRRYVWELYSALLSLGADIECVAVGVPDGAAVPHGVRAIRPAWQPRSNLIWSATAALALRGVSYDVFHAPAYTKPLAGVGPTLLTVHDISYAANDRYYPHRIDPVRRMFYRYCARTADAIVTDADFTRDEIERIYRIPAARIHVVPLGVGAPFATEAPLPAADPATTPPVVLAVGDVHPRRNLALLLSAILELRRTTPALDHLTLRVIGNDRGSGDTLRQLAAQAGMPEALELLGRVSEAELLSHYRSSSLLAYPSLYEGFGLPLLEAMAAGLPVVAARSSAVPETTGSAALLVDPYDVAAWVTSLREVILDSTLAARLRERGRERARERSWRCTAQQTLDLMRMVAAGTHS